MVKIFEIPGLAIGKQRPRGRSRGNFVQMYTPKKTIVYESCVQDAYLRKYSAVDIIKKPTGVIARINIFKQIPASYSKKKKRAIMAGEISLITKPDVDNVAKSVCDALNGIAYEDDAQICMLKVEKNYTDQESYVVVEIEKI